MWVPCFSRAATQGRPYARRVTSVLNNDYDAVKMIGHDDVFVGFNHGELVR